MTVEILGGTLGGQEKKIERFYEYFFFEDEIYYAKMIKYKQLGWIYVWYEYSGDGKGVQVGV